jgi:hypothetical protein
LPAAAAHIRLLAVIVIIDDAMFEVINDAKK